MRSILSFLILVVGTTHLFAQTSLTYLFEKNGAAEEGGISLVLKDSAGTFERVALPAFDGLKKTVYRFQGNPEFYFDNQGGEQFLGESYALEAYLEFDDLKDWKKVFDFKNRTSDQGFYFFHGNSAFWQAYVSEEVVVKPKEFFHLIVTRNASTQEVSIYINGKKESSFIDEQGIAVLDKTQRLYLFTDDLEYDSKGGTGSVALFKVYGHAFAEKEVDYAWAHLEETLRGKPMFATLEGEVVNAQKGFPMANVTVELKKGNHRVASTLTDSKGHFSFPHLGEGVKYTVAAKRDGYLYTDTTLLIEQLDQQRCKLALSTIAVGMTINLKSIQFEQNKAELLPSSFEELDKLARLMNQNPTMEIALSGHTDNLGSPKHSVELSQQRVEAVKNYLVEKGVQKKRITGHGYGGSKPIADNTNPETRKLNRRVEVTFTKL